jgi:hypothetical protein
MRLVVDGRDQAAPAEAAIEDLPRVLGSKYTSNKPRTVPTAGVPGSNLIMPSCTRRFSCPRVVIRRPWPRDLGMIAVSE